MSLSDWATILTVAKCALLQLLARSCTLSKDAKAHTSSNLLASDDRWTKDSHCTACEGLPRLVISAKQIPRLGGHKPTPLNALALIGAFALGGNPNRLSDRIANGRVLFRFQTSR
jgi:hypothetical protein